MATTSSTYRRYIPPVDYQPTLPASITSTASAYAYAQQQQQQQLTATKANNHGQTTTTSSTGSNASLPIQDRRLSPLSDRPHSIEELARIANASQLPEEELAPDLKVGLRYSEIYMHQALEDHESGDIEMAFINYARAATMVAKRVTSHKQFYEMKQGHRDMCEKRGDQCLENMEDLKPLVCEQYKLWRLQNPNAPHHQLDLPRILNWMKLRDREEKAQRDQAYRVKKAQKKMMEAGGGRSGSSNDHYFQQQQQQQQQTRPPPDISSSAKQQQPSQSYARTAAAANEEARRKQAVEETQRKKEREAEERRKLLLEQQERAKKEEVLAARAAFEAQQKQQQEAAAAAARQEAINRRRREEAEAEAEAARRRELEETKRREIEETKRREAAEAERAKKEEVLAARAAFEAQQEAAAAARQEAMNRRRREEAEAEAKRRELEETKRREAAEAETKRREAAEAESKRREIEEKREEAARKLEEEGRRREQEARDRAEARRQEAEEAKKKALEATKMEELRRREAEAEELRKQEAAEESRRRELEESRRRELEESKRRELQEAKRRLEEARRREEENKKRVEEAKRKEEEARKREEAKRREEEEARQQEEEARKRESEAKAREEERRQVAEKREQQEATIRRQRSAQAVSAVSSRTSQRARAPTGLSIASDATLVAAAAGTTDDGLPVLPLESPTRVNNVDTRHPQPRHATNERARPSIAPPITTTSPPPTDIQAASLTRLMSPHQRAQGYAPSLQSMFMVALPVPPTALLFAPNHPEGPSAKNFPQSPDRPPAHVRHLHAITHGIPMPEPPRHPPSKDSRILFTDQIQADEKATLDKPELKIVQVPNDVTTRFLSVAALNTARNKETCGLLLGKQENHKFKVTTLLIPKQVPTDQSCDMEEEELVTEFTQKRKLITLGWIHTHPTQTCFFTSSDLHIHAAFQNMLPEFFGIVCAPRQIPPCAVFRLTDPLGLSRVLNCVQKDPNHAHIQDESDMSIYTDCDKGHVLWVGEALAEIVDLR